jgi:NAD(P)-dependent dehydrogenase (short-subunit alcohol dehydrogenase family)
MTGVLRGVAMVTGTSPNIGAGLALALAEAGAAVACVDADGATARRCAEDLGARGHTAIGLGCDVTDEETVRGAFEQVGRELGAVTTLVNAAAVFDQRGVTEMPVAAWRRQIDVILTGTFLCTKLAVEGMIAARLRGAVINLISSAGHQGEPGNVAYSTAKGGLLNFTRAAAMDAARWGIRVNSLTPTATDPRDGLARAEAWGLTPGGPLSDPAKVEEFLAQVRRKVPLGELPTPADYGAAAVFLASDAARMITGSDLKVDAGTLAKYWRWDPGDPVAESSIPSTPEGASRRGGDT